MLFLLLNIPVLFGAYLLSSAIWPGGRRTVERAAATLLLWYAAIVMITTACGATGHLSAGPLRVGSIVFFVVSVLGSGVIYKFRKHGKQAKIDADAAQESGRAGVFEVALIAAAAFACFIIFIWGVISPPPPWDAFVYHLPFAATWLRDGRISLVTVPFGDQAGTYFPSNTELYFAWLMLPFRSEIITNAGQFPFYCAIAALVYLIGGQIGLGKKASVASAAIALFIPGMMHQAVSSEVDIIFAALFLFSIFFILKYANEEFSVYPALLAGISTGLLAGTKFIGLPFSALVAVPAVIVFIKNRRAGHAAVFILCAAAAGGFWYVRNWAATGNPIFPLSLSIFGAEVFPGGYPRSSMYYSVFHSNSPAAWLKAMLATTGAPLGALLGASAIAAPVYLLRFKNKLPQSAQMVCALPIAIIAICALAIPYNLESRFTYAAWAVACLCAGLALDSNNKLIRNCATAAVFIAVAASLFENSFFRYVSRTVMSLLAGSGVSAGDTGARMRGAAILLALCVFLAAASAALFTRRLGLRRFSNLAAYSAALVGALFFTSAVDLALPAYREYKLSYQPGFMLGQAWRYLDAHQSHYGPKEANIAFTGTDLSFGLFGSTLQNDVYSAPINAHPDWKFHDCVKALKDSGEYEAPLTDRIDFCRRDPDPAAWMSNLARKKTEFVLISTLHQNDLPHLSHDGRGFPIELAWAEANPQVFHLIYANPQTRLFAFNRAGVKILK